MVNQRDDLKVTDFGIARSLTDSVSRLTMEQGRGGTLTYMSPQQLNGEHCTHLDDIYSLGASIYELLTSKPPFYSGNIDWQICERVAPSLAERRKELDIEPASVPQVWEETVAACLAKDPPHRPQSAAEVAQRLQLAPAPARTRVTPSKRLNRKTLIIGGITSERLSGRRNQNQRHRQSRKNRSPSYPSKTGAKKKPTPTLPTASRTRF